jgi:glutathione peroxidase
MVNHFSEHRSTYGPSGKMSSWKKFSYIALALVLIFVIFMTKFLFEDRYSARQNIVFEKTGRGHNDGNNDVGQEHHSLRHTDTQHHDSRDDSIFKFNLPNSDGQSVNMGEMFAGKYKLLLIANVASKWGKTTRNYEQLQALYDTYHPLGLEILAVPCDQFKHQEPGSNKEIEQFARENMHAEFPVMGKVKVNGAGASDMFAFLRAKTMNKKQIRGNFAKFLVDAQGHPLLAYDPKMNPKQMEGQIKLLLDKAASA